MGVHRRDRHGHGMRGLLTPPDSPLARTRSETFDNYVLESFERLEQRWPRELSTVEVAVVEVPENLPHDADTPHRDSPPAESRLAEAMLDSVVENSMMAFGRLVPRAGSFPARIVVYRWPLERRARGTVRQLNELVNAVLVYYVAELLNLPIEEVDPRYAEDEFPGDFPDEE